MREKNNWIEMEDENGKLFTQREEFFASQLRRTNGTNITFRPRSLLREDLEYYRGLTSEAVDEALEGLEEEEDLIRVKETNGVVVIKPTEKGLERLEEIQEEYKERLRKLRRRFGFRG